MPMEANISDITVMPPPLTESVSRDDVMDEALENADTKAITRSWWLRVLIWIGSVVDWFFGLIAIVGGVALLSVVPGLNFLSLGYLLEVSGRVAKTGKLRSGFVGIRKASVIGSAVVGIWIILLPVRFAFGMWRDAELITPGGSTASGWRVGLIVISVLALLHIVWACVRGGRPWHFLWPAPLRFWRWMGEPGKLSNIWRGLSAYLLELNVPYYFWLGARGFAGAVIWLIVPVGLLILAADMSPGPGAAVSLIGVLMLTPVVMWLPFLQAHFAKSGRFKAMFEVREIRRLFKNAPVAFWLAFFITLLFALPLYLLKVELTPRDVAWGPSVLFVIFILPARLLAGWAMSRATRGEQMRHGFFRWTSRLAFIPVALAYVLIVYATQYLAQNGSMSLLEQHAFLVPTPMIGM